MSHDNFGDAITLSAPIHGTPSIMGMEPSNAVYSFLEGWVRNIEVSSCKCLLSYDYAVVGKYRDICERKHVRDARAQIWMERKEIWRGRAHLDGEWGSRKGLLEAAVVEGAERHKQERTQAPTQLSPTSQRQLHTCCGFWSKWLVRIVSDLERLSKNYLYFQREGHTFKSLDPAHNWRWQMKHLKGQSGPPLVTKNEHFLNRWNI